MGAFDTLTSTSIELHSFVAEKGDYYEINDGVPQNGFFEKRRKKQINIISTDTTRL